MRAEIGEGLRFLFGHRVLRAGVLLVSASNLAFMAGEAVLVLFATDELGLGSRGYGLLLAAVAVGGVPGSLLAARVGERVPPGALIVGGDLTGGGGDGLLRAGPPTRGWPGWPTPPPGRCGGCGT